MPPSTTSWRTGVVALVVLAVVLTAGAVIALRSTATETSDVAAPYGPSGPVVLEILSGKADLVSGGDALLQVRLGSGVTSEQLEVTRNGMDVTDAFTARGGADRQLTGLVSGLRSGWNVVQARAGSAGQYRATLRLRNHPLAGPMFSGPKQYPFLCKTEESGIGQPVIDNQDGQGRRVYNDAGDVVGWSRDCLGTTRVDYVYRSTRTGEFLGVPADGSRPPDLAKVTLPDGRVVDYVVRRERGTINRFIYAISMLAPFGEDPAGPPDHSRWNGKLVMRFDGGIGIGHDQGLLESRNYLDDTLLSAGYAIVFSTGTHTTIQYNLVLGAETALMTKERFIERHGVPRYTVGVGVSGGGIEQYLYAQRYPGRLIDAAIPQFSYPDMITQIPHIADCELLERYMDASSDPKWHKWSNRTWLHGLSASDTIANPHNNNKPGSDECVKSWRGLTPLVLNPNFTFGYDALLWPYVDPPGSEDAIHWTHWDDLRTIYGVGDDGYARNPWGNEGVQYGLQALTSGKITPAEFLDLNANVGTWKESADMVGEGCPFVPATCPDPEQWDPWSSRNMLLSPDGGRTPAPRRSPDLGAFEAADRAGMVFHGDVDIPIIDWRIYEEAALSLNDSVPSFAIRQRMLDVDGDANNMVIWFIAPPEPRNEMLRLALDTIDEWLANIDAHPDRGVVGNKPPGAVDRCFDRKLQEIASGPHVWDGILTDAPAGACTKAYPVNSNSRMVAGAPLQYAEIGCRLIPVEAAIGAGVYGSWQPTSAQRERLAQIFPTGVCDYTTR